MLRLKFFTDGITDTCGKKSCRRTDDDFGVNDHCGRVHIQVLDTYDLVRFVVEHNQSAGRGIARRDRRAHDDRNVKLGGHPFSRVDCLTTAQRDNGVWLVIC
ncbi:hypothetical protein D3C75_855570 [compost metagenome]